MANGKVYLNTPSIFMNMVSIAWHFERRAPMEQLQQTLIQCGIFTDVNTPADSYVAARYFIARPPEVDEGGIFRDRFLFISSKGVHLIMEALDLMT